MFSVRTLLLAALAALSLNAMPALAQALDITGSKPAAEAEAKPAAPSLAEQIQQQAEQTATARQQLEERRTQLAQAPKEIVDARRALDALKAKPDEDPARRYAGLNVAALDQRLAERIDELAEWQKQLSAANSLIITAQTRPERAQAAIGSAQARIQEINAQLKSGRDGGKSLGDEQRSLLNAELETLGAQIELRRQELAGNSLMQDLGKARRDLLAERIARAELETQALQALINEKRRAESEQTVAELSAKAEQAGSDTLLAAESAENLKLSDYLLRATERLNDLNQQNLRTRQQLDTLTQTDQALEEQISVLEGSLLL